MKSCHFCASTPMLPIATIQQPDGKPPVVLVQCPRCQRLLTDDGE